MGIVTGIATEMMTGIAIAMTGPNETVTKMIEIVIETTKIATEIVIEGTKMIATVRKAVKMRKGIVIVIKIATEIVIKTGIETATKATEVRKKTRRGLEKKIDPARDRGLLQKRKTERSVPVTRSVKD